MTWQKKISLLISRGWRIEGISEATRASSYTVRRWVKGESKPRLVYQEKIDELLKEGNPRDDIPTSA